MTTPEERRDAAVNRLRNAGGCVRTTRPLAHPSTPHDVAMYEVAVTPPAAALGHLRPQFDEALAAVERPADGLVPWTPVPEVFEEEEDEHALGSDG